MSLRLSEQAGNRSGGIGEAPRVDDGRLSGPADDDCGGGFVGLDKLDGDATGCVDLAGGQLGYFGHWDSLSREVGSWPWSVFSAPVGAAYVFVILLRIDS
jgi:hypothetical protein